MQTKQHRQTKPATTSLASGISPTLGEGARRRCFGRSLPSTLGEVDFHTDCFGAFSFRLDSPQRAEEPLEVESCGRRCVEKAATYSHSPETQRSGGRQSSHSEK